jgi:hypothetical protein
MPSSKMTSIYHIGELPLMVENQKIIFQEDNTYKVTIHRTPDQIYFINIYVVTFNGTLASKLSNIVFKLVNARHKIGVINHFTYCITLYCPHQSASQIGVAILFTKHQVSDDFPQFSLMANTNRMVVIHNI